jgi:hypothetical protein
MNYQDYLETRIARLREEALSLEEELKELKISTTKAVIYSSLCEMAKALGKKRK